MELKLKNVWQPSYNTFCTDDAQYVVNRHRLANTLHTEYHTWIKADYRDISSSDPSFYISSSTSSGPQTPAKI
jgi:hypothetical protein